MTSHARPDRAELPPAIAAPLGPEAGVFTRLPRPEKELLEKHRGGDGIFLVVKTGTRVDTGGWLRKRRVWVFVFSGEFVLLAGGRKSYVEKIPFGRLGETRYNHVTGELVLAPADGMRVRKVRVSPLEGYQMLAQVRSKRSEHA